MKNLVLLTLLLIGKLGFSQIYGDLVKDKRQVIQQIDYAIKGNSTGQIVFDIVVDEKGNVTSCVVDKAKTSVKSTPTMMKAKNSIVGGLKFKASSMYPQFHRGEVVIKIYQ
jgi:hypothetical protein